MNQIAAVTGRLRQASGLAAILDAACDAFGDMLSVLWDRIDPGEPLFIALLTAATCAADGRDTVLFAPSLPPHRCPAAPQAGSGQGSVDAVAGAVAGLCVLLAARLAEAATSAADHGDRAACHAAARYARQIHEALAGASPL